MERLFTSITNAEESAKRIKMICTLAIMPEKERII